MAVTTAATVDAGEDEGDKKTEGMGDLVFGISRFRASMRLLAIRLANGRQFTPPAVQVNITVIIIVIIIIVAVDENDESRRRGHILRKV